MSSIVEFLSAVMNLGVHGHLVFSDLQFKTRYELSIGALEDSVQGKHVLDSLEPATHKSTTFEVEEKALRYVCTPGI